METKNITLELLVRDGNPDGVEYFADAEKLSEPLKTEKIAEASIYSAIEVMWEEAEGGIDSERVCQFLNQPNFTSYFDSTRNTVLLQEIVDVLRAGTNAQMEAYAQITAIDVLGVDSLAGAIRRNIDVAKMREKVTGLVQAGYGLVFCPSNIDAEQVNHYFPIIDKWRDLINPRKVAAESIKEIAENISEGDKDLFDPDYKYRKEFVYAALDKLIELTDRKTVSGLMHQHFRKCKGYKELIEERKIDAPVPKPLSKEHPKVDDKVKDAIEKYESERFPYDFDVKELAKTVGDGGKEYIAQRMGQWFREGRMKHLSEVAVFENGRLYDHNIAKKVVGEAIAESCEQGNLAKLDGVLDFPSHLIDETNPKIDAVVQAYKISQQTKKKRE